MWRLLMESHNGFHRRRQIFLHSSRQRRFLIPGPFSAIFLDRFFSSPLGTLFSYIAHWRGLFSLIPFAFARSSPFLLWVYSHTSFGDVSLLLAQRRKLQNEGLDEQLGPELIFCNFKASERSPLIDSAPFLETSPFRLR